MEGPICNVFVYLFTHLCYLKLDSVVFVLLHFICFYDIGVCVVVVISFHKNKQMNNTNLLYTLMWRRKSLAPTWYLQTHHQDVNKLLHTLMSNEGI